jgi:hypothetical protein
MKMSGINLGFIFIRGSIVPSEICEGPKWVFIKKYSSERIHKLGIANLIMATSFEREILNPALATASTLSDASIVLNDFVLQNKQDGLSQSE